jgi:hypothetical protein
MNQQSDNDASNLARFGPDVFRRLADTSADGIGMARLDSRIIYAIPPCGACLNCLTQAN